MRKERMDKLCASYMEDARGLKRNTPNREFVLRLIEDAYKAGLEDAYKGIKPFNWAVTKYGMSAATLVGLFVIRPFLKGGFELDYNGETVCTPPTLSKAKKIANKLYKRKVKEKFGL
ncbi:MAG: hypothetical protein HXN77_09260 [Prevotella pallens]|uniref:hypothetical protein n=1 Tax=Prevotella pallens TaxID=60133 RepID=UPI001CADCED5|nr:hypothetical protein [Prevotella pallens]MBF1490671.1 hypothetical protein [Prevotella pallens]